jgi:tetratricopeptide (TPR) repeat protein
MNLQENRKIPMKQTAFVCVVVIALGAVTGCIATKETYVSRGNKLYDAGRFEEATLNYQKAIQKDPKFGEAYYRLGLAALKQKEQGRLAYDSLYRAVQLLPDNVEVMEKFADLVLAVYLADPHHPQFLYTEITQLSQELLAKNPNSYKGLMLRGYLEQTDRKPKEAIDDFRKALRIDSSDAGVKTALAQTLMLDGQQGEGEKLALDLIYNQKTSFGPVYELVYGLYLDAKPKRIADAENILKAKVNNNPKDADYIVELARFYQGLQKPVEMKAALQRLLDDPKTFPKARLWVGDFYMGLRDYPEAMHNYQEGIRATPAGKDRQVFQNAAIVALLSEGKNAEALRLAEQTIKEDPQDDLAKRLRADIWMDSGEADKVEDAFRSFKALSAQYPNDATLRFHLARAFMRKGNLQAAQTELQEAIKKRSDFVEARIDLGRISIMRKRPDQALQQANDILKLHPDSHPAKLLRTRALIGTGDLKTAQVELAKLEKDSPRDTQVQLQLALLAAADKKVPQATALLDTLRNTSDSDVFIALASIYLSQRQPDKAFAILNEGLKKSDSPEAIHTQLAVTALVTGRLDMAIAEFQKLVDADPKSVEDLRRLADAYELKGAQEDAIKLYRKAYEMRPGDLDSALALAGAMALAGHTAEARTQYLGIAKAHPEDPVVLNNTAYLLADSGGDLDQALQYAQSALAKNPKEPGFSDTVGYIYLKKGQKDSAIRTFGNLVRQNPHFPAFRYHLGLALYENGDKTGARKELRAALADHPSKQDEQRIKELLGKLG